MKENSGACLHFSRTYTFVFFSVQGILSALGKFTSQVHGFRSNKQTCISESLLERRGQTRLAINERNQGVEQGTQLVI